MRQAVAPARLAAVLAAAAAILAIGGYTLLGAPQQGDGAGEPGGGALSFGLGLGDRLVYNITLYTYIDGVLNRSEYNVVEVRVVGFLLPFAGVNVSQDGSVRFAEVPLGLVALPLDWLGDAAGVPIAVGYTWLCLPMTPEGRSPWAGGEALVYRGGLERPNLTLDVVALYDSDTGALVRMKVNMSVAGPQGGGAAAIVIQELVDYELSGEGVSGSYQEDYTCGPGVSSDLRFVLEGLYRLEDGEPVPVDAGEVGEAVGGRAVLVVLDKQCPACQLVWPKLLRASGDEGLTFYALVYDPSSQLATPDMAYVISNIVQPAFNRLDRPGVPAFLAFRGGELVAAEIGDLEYGELVDWLRSALSP